MPKPNAEPGTYALVLAAEKRQTIQVGKLGTFDVRPGHYVYVGSALGPGGLAARIGRHAQHDKRLRWHVDYLRAATKLAEVWWLPGAERQECRWAECFAGMAGVETPMARFGASDCECRSHLFYFLARPSLNEFRRVLGRLAGATGLILQCGMSEAAFRSSVAAARRSAAGRTRR